MSFVMFVKSANICVKFGNILFQMVDCGQLQSDFNAASGNDKVPSMEN